MLSHPRRSHRRKRTTTIEQVGKNAAGTYSSNYSKSGGTRSQRKRRRTLSRLPSMRKSRPGFARRLKRRQLSGKRMILVCPQSIVRITQ